MIAACALAIALGVLGSSDPADEPPADQRTVRERDPADTPWQPPAPDEVAPDEAGALPPAQHPMGALPVAALQCLTGCAVVGGALPLSLLCTSAGCLGAPFVVGYFETWVGDSLGDSRAPAIVPIITAYVGAGLSAGSVVAVYFIALESSQPQSLASAGAIGMGAALLALTGLAVPLSYHLSAEPKHALDDGTEAPDFFVPRVPHAARKPSS